MTRNKEVAEILKEIALLLDVKGSNVFKIRAFNRAVRTISSLGEDIETISQRGTLTDISGIGKGIAEVITDYLENGTSTVLEELRLEIPVKVMELQSIPGIGPKTIKLVYEKLGVIDIESLEKAAEEDKISALPGMGEKSQEQILEGIQLVKSGIGRSLLASVMPIAEMIEQKIGSLENVRELKITGSYRRRRETVRDLDVLVDADNPAKVMETFVNLDDVADIIAHGTTKSAIRLENNLQVDLRIIPSESYGAGMQYFTGNVDHNVRLRQLAQKKGYKLNEYGLYKGEKQIAGKDEAGIYEKLDLPLIPPELRENQGEIEAAQQGELPKLISLKDIHGDLHSHTDQSDGRNTIEEMLDAAAQRNYEYYCVSDHTQSLTIANGMDETRLLRRIDEIDDLNASSRWKMKILKGAEVDILSDGGLDITDDVLEQLDVVTVSIHSRMKDSKELMTERVCHALENKHVHILGHPTGRLIFKRPEFDIDLEAVFETAKTNNIIMELNAHPRRLDLNAGNLRSAKRMGLKIAINTDAHDVYELENLKFGVFQARRGWLEKRDVVNAHPLKKMLSLLKK